MAENQSFSIQPIAHIRTDFPAKFGIPRQSMLIDSLQGEIIFEPHYRNPDALRGLEDFSHLWIIWQFSQTVTTDWSPTVRPPRLGGNKRMGVFATRSPFRPNSLALSVVKIEKIDLHTPIGPVITVSGIDMLDNTPIFDIKPYLPHIDSISTASGGFALPAAEQKLDVEFSGNARSALPQNLLISLQAILEQDPRPHYQEDENRTYGFSYNNYEIHFRVKENRLTVVSATKKQHPTQR
ncbi:MAG: tRNA (N6-threonylcarbamoyladenosine(37)-N6)-methyltransferase TrmO [Ruminococcaceae bacterium]|nr:tRNA (N6-threonylcarbamoyladenosine(37)-N6)-methyltransferase TrmO [Oscillospiraceae bacterium]